MGNKVNPTSFRLQVHKNWSSRWFAGKKDFSKWLHEDIKIRELIEKRFSSRPTINIIEIERSANLITITIHTAKAGVVIGRGGAGVTELKEMIERNGSNALIEVDGGVNKENASTLVKAGVDILVAGNAIFKSENPLDAIHSLRNCLS